MLTSVIPFQNGAMLNTCVGDLLVNCPKPSSIKYPGNPASKLQIK